MGVTVRLLFVAALAIASMMARDNEPAARLDEASAVLSEIMATQDKGIPEDMLENEGATLRQARDDNATLYGRKLDNRQIVTTRVRTPAEAAKLITVLDSHSARERGSTALRTEPLLNRTEPLLK